MTTGPVEPTNESGAVANLTPGPWRIYDATDRYAVKILGVDPHIGNVHVASALGAGNARLIVAAPELFEVLKAFVAQEVDYMTINNLGDPEKQHNVKWARAVFAKVEGA